MNKLILNPEYVSEMHISENKEGGFVYIFEAHFGQVKIGSTKNVRRRITEIEALSGGARRNLCLSAACSNYRRIENTLHKLFDANRTHSEWFNVSFDKVVNALKQQKLEPVLDAKQPPDTLLRKLLVQSFPEESLFDGFPQIKEYIDRQGLRVFWDDVTKDFFITDDETFCEKFKLYMQFEIAASV